MENRETVSVDEWQAQAGRFERHSPWIEVTQAMIDQFAHATHDHQFIHVDAERAARETPFGGTIAHGFLTLSMLSAMAYETLPSIRDTALGINYGFDKVRFVMPVRSGARIRAAFHLISVERRKDNEILSRHAVTIEIEGTEKPALIAEWLTLVMLGAAQDNSGT